MQNINAWPKIFKDVDANTPYSIRDRNLRIDWVRLGEGFSGDFNAEDPDDRELLRFDIFFRENEPEAHWDVQESRCTMMPADTDEVILIAALNVIYDRVSYECSDHNCSISWLADELSWLSPEAVAVKQNNYPVLTGVAVEQD